MISSAFGASRVAVALVLNARRAAIGASIIAGKASGRPKVNRYGDAPEQLRQRVDDWLGLLIGCFQDRPGYTALLGGQVRYELYQPEQTAEQNFADMSATIAALWREIESGSHDALDPEQQAALRSGLEQVFAGLLKPSERHVRTLLVGDCLSAEIAGLTTDITARKGISFETYPINARDPLQLASNIARLSQQQYDVIFFSPFSHSRTIELEEILRPSPSLTLRGKAAVDVLSERIIAQTEPLLAYLLERYECPIYVHDAGMVPRATSAAKAAVLDLATRRQRALAGQRLNAWLHERVARTHVSGSRRLQIVPESEIVARIGTLAAGQYLNNSDFQHPTRLSLELSYEYAQRLEMLANLHGKKLVVCDLDNTLWDGTIGEGAVAHFAERQSALLRLKHNSGVVLSIASKNDPAKVHFTGGVLAEGDFVAPQISWGFKADAFKVIRDAINIQYRHMVFLDDRADERALVSERFPDVLALDATDPLVWRRIELWADLIEGSSELDRTKLYQEQAARDAFAGTGGAVAVADADMIARLGLGIEVRAAAKADLKRVAELINRTNQWNMCGSRTSLAELNAVIAAGGHVLLARVSDRFGDMGDVCAAVISVEGEQATIPIFVLSCRVFGYGVETAMLNEISTRVGLGARSKRLIGRYIATNQNQMARDMYTDHGYTKEGESFVLESHAAELRTA